MPPSSFGSGCAHKTDLAAVGLQVGVNDVQSGPRGDVKVALAGNVEASVQSAHETLVTLSTARRCRRTHLPLPEL